MDGDGKIERHCLGKRGGGRTKRLNMAYAFNSIFRMTQQQIGGVQSNTELESEEEKTTIAVDINKCYQKE